MCGVEGEDITFCVFVVELLPFPRSEASVLTVGFLEEPLPSTQHRFSNDEQIYTKINPSKSEAASLSEIFKSIVAIIP